MNNLNKDIFEYKMNIVLVFLSDMKRFLIISIAGIILPGALGAAVSYGLYHFLLDSSNEEPFSSFLLFTIVAMAITVKKIDSILFFN